MQVIDQFTVKFVLQEPDATFLSLLATPPYFPISNECYSEAQDDLSSCGGLGPYTIVSWTPGEQMRLRANPEWPGRPSPAFENILIRFQDDTAVLRRSLEAFQSIDIAWTGLPYSDFTGLQTSDANGDGLPDYKAWTGPAAFKSYFHLQSGAGTVGQQQSAPGLCPFRRSQCGIGRLVSLAAADSPS